MKTDSTLDLLRAYESPNVTFIEADGSWPIVWDRAKGVHVWDAEDRKYLDLTAAFGVAAAGHGNPRVVAAGRRQMGHLLHAMGDVHPHRGKAELARELSRLTFERWTSATHNTRPAFHAKTIFCNSGFEAVEAALKSALLLTGKPGVIAFEGAYHGLGYGALNATHRVHFRGPFLTQLRRFGFFVPFPSDERHTVAQVEAAIRRLLHTKKIGAILVEPIQARGGIQVPPLDFLPMLRRICSEHEVSLILDEIYTGFGRTGEWFACEHAGVMPDFICLGKALTGGFPLSACVGRADLMDKAWPASTGEAIHTSTFLGHPVGCSMALANLKELKNKRLVAHSAKVGAFLLARLSAMESGLSRATNLRIHSRGLGLLAGLDLQFPDGTPATTPTLEAIKALLRHGFIFLPEGEHANVISFTPPLTISENQIGAALEAVAEVLRSLSRR